MAKIDYQDLVEIHRRLRREFFFPPTSINVIDDEETPAYIENGKICINPEILEDLAHAEGIVAHEIGHMEICPVSVAKAKKYIMIVADELGVANDAYYTDVDVCHQIMNVIADMIVDKDDRILKRLPHRIKCDFESVKRRMKGKLPKHPFWLVLAQYYNLLIKKKMLQIPPKEQETGKQAFRIITSLAPMEIKIRKVAKLLANQEFMKEYEEVKEFLKKLDAAMGKGLSRLNVRENLKKNKGDLKRAIGDTVDTKQGKKGDEKTRAEMAKDKRILIGMAKAAKVEFNDYDYLRAVGRKKIEFNIKIMRPAVGRIVRGSLETWTPDDDVAELEIEDSIMNNPLLIPGLSTLKAEKKAGFEEAPSIPPVLMVLDTSGSMDRTTAMIICYSFVAACEHYKTPASIVMFSHAPYFTAGFTEQYETFARKIFDNYRSGGTDTLSAASKAAGILRNRGRSLLIFISDFECYNKKRTIDVLRELKNRHYVMNIVIRNYSVSGNDFEGIGAKFIDGPDDISNLVIQEIGDTI